MPLVERMLLAGRKAVGYTSCVRPRIASRFRWSVRKIDVRSEFVVVAAAIAMTLGWACAGSESARRASPSTGGQPEPSSERKRTSEAPNERRNEPLASDSQQSSGSPAMSRHGEFRVEAEVGGLDTEAVERVLQDLDDDVDRCWQRASNQLLAGTLAAVILVDGEGRAAAHAERTTLGNRALERCVLSIFEQPSWPRPVGGKTGIVRRKLTFDLAGGARAPAAWAASRVADVVSANSAAITSCKAGSRGRFVATAYLETVLVQPDSGAGSADAGYGGAADAAALAPVEIGRTISVGMAPPNAAGETQVDCLVGVLEKATWPAPGTWPAKVTFEL
jgi:hypothetical protein